MLNVDNIQHADAVQDSTSARLGTSARNGSADCDDGRFIFPKECSERTLPEAIDAKSKSWSSEYRAKFTLALLSRDKIQRN